MRGDLVSTHILDMNRSRALFSALALLLSLAAVGCGAGAPGATPTVIAVPAGETHVPTELGVYVRLPQSLLKVRGWEMVFIQPPPDTLRLKAGEVLGFVIHQRNDYELERTHLWLVGTNSEKPILLQRLPEEKAMLVHLETALGRGAYVLEVPKDSIMGGKNWYYVVVE